MILTPNENQLHFLSGISTEDRYELENALDSFYMDCDNRFYDYFSDDDEIDAFMYEYDALYTLINKLQNDYCDYDELINKIYEIHRSTCEPWSHGEPVHAWPEERYKWDKDKPVQCIAYEDGTWWYYQYTKKGKKQDIDDLRWWQDNRKKKEM